MRLYKCTCDELGYEGHFHDPDCRWQRSEVAKMVLRYRADHGKDPHWVEDCDQLLEEFPEIRLE